MCGVKNEALAVVLYWLVPYRRRNVCLALWLVDSTSLLPDTQQLPRLVSSRLLAHCCACPVWSDGSSVIVLSRRQDIRMSG